MVKDYQLLNFFYTVTGGFQSYANQNNNVKWQSAKIDGVEYICEQIGDTIRIYTNNEILNITYESNCDIFKKMG